MSLVASSTTLATTIPSPTTAVWNLGPIPIRAYAMCILAGIVLAVWLTERRLVARGARPGSAIDISVWAVPFGIVGGRIYHVITDHEKYFGPGRNPWDALKIYEGGLGIWGAIALGALGAWFGCRQYKVDFRDFIDAAAPGVAFAQAIGRLGNWFNNELYGAPTDLPWGLQIHEWNHATGSAVIGPDGQPVVLGHFQPTFLYELIWLVALGFFLLWLGRRFRLARGRTFAAYVMGYPIGRIVVENLRTDEATHVFGQRINTWTSILVFLIGVVLWWWFGRRAAREATGAEDTASADASSVEGDGAPDTESSPTDDDASEAGDSPSRAGESEPGSPPTR